MYSFQMNYKFKPNDKVKSKSNIIGKIIKQASFNELDLDFHWSEKNYLVETIEKKKFVISEQDLTLFKD